MAGMPGPHPIRRRPRTAWLVAAAVPAVLTSLAACTSSGSLVATATPAPRLTAALARWAAFPATAATRPLVVGTSAEVTGPDSFPNGPDKDAFLTGAITLPRSLPTGPASRAGFPLISAARAASVLTAGQAMGPSPSGRLTVTKVQLGTGVFITDRGKQALPAWRFSFRGVSGPADVLAVAASERFWPSGLKQVTTQLQAAQAGRSGRVLTLTVDGAQAGTGPCQASYAVRQRSSGHAVALDVVATQHGSQGGCASVGYRVNLPVTLPAPLGNRVLVDAATSAPIPVFQPLVSSS